MPLPLIFIGIAAVTGSTGLGKTIKAAFDMKRTKSLNADSQARLDYAAAHLEEMRKQCGYSLEALGKEKVFVLNNSIRHFLDDFTQIKNVDFTSPEGLDELDKLHIDSKEFEELGDMSRIAGAIAGGVFAGAAGGALAAFGAYSAAGALATASTGTAIATLSGAAATNATLAFFGGGSLAAGGLGIAGGTAVLGSLVAGPALLVMGAIVGAKANKDLEAAKANAVQASEICAQLESGALQCVSIRRRTYMFYSLLARLEAFLTPLLFKMDEILKNEGLDYSKYSTESKKVISSAASTTITIKSILDTAILTEEGELTEDSKILLDKIQ